jgi:chromosome segregation protein
VDFQRLRLSGFKSFVEPNEFRIEPGLTGVVGPNGCGKSNILEALRWVMGANSAKAMRGTGMDDVIFSGASNRPPRNHAEVSLTIDNSRRKAPAPFTDAPILEVTRRIDRGEGSTYRVNGKEVRARDVQLLFADASTGANSPALVRQGQISELIAAKPQNRRRILEEAGGVAGLHNRRHEAELRLRGAETNLSRLDDVTRELETNFNRLRREARQAERYKKISGEIRALQGAVLYGRWLDAKTALERAREELAETTSAVETTASAAAQAQTLAIDAAEALKPLREEDAVAAAVLHRLTLERDRLEGEERQARAEVERLEGELMRIDTDRDREARNVEDAGGQLARLSAEIAALEAEIAASPKRGPELEAAFAAAEAIRADAQAEVERIAGAMAADRARAEAAAARRREAEARLQRAQHALTQARAEREALGPLEDPQIETARRALTDAVQKLQAARAALEAAEAKRASAQQAEAAARQNVRQQEDKLGRLQTEARGLAQLLTASKREFPPALDAVRADKGYEAALAAAFGDDLDAALDPQAPAYWGGADANPPAWPPGVEPLAGHIEAPAALTARLGFIGVVAQSDGARLASSLPSGARLVSKEGDLWRWDGFVARAEAPKPAAVRLAQRTRLAELEAEIDRLKPAVDEAQQAHRAAVAAVQEAESELQPARRAPPEAERAVAGARDHAERLAREQTRREARAQTLDETTQRLEAEAGEAQDILDREASGENTGGSDELQVELDAARERAEAARSDAAQARLERDAESRERAGREQRLTAFKRDHADWQRRSKISADHVDVLANDRERTFGALERARSTPGQIAERREQLLDGFNQAEERRKASADALAEDEKLAQDSDKAARAADHAAGQAREARAGAIARDEAATQRMTETEAQVRETAHMSPEELGQKLKDEAIAQPKDAAGAESLLYGLEREREQLGAVNLLAEDEAKDLNERLQSMKSERLDLTNAIKKLRDGIDELNSEGRERLLAAFDVINEHFKALFQALFDGGQAELRLVESDDPLEAGLEIYACPPGKRLATMSLMSGGEQALTASALIFGVFLANPAPVCVLDEVDAPLDDANVDRFCRMLDEMRRRTDTRFVVITHNPVTMSRVDRLFGVTMPERGISQLVSVDLTQAEMLAAQ